FPVGWLTMSENTTPAHNSTSSTAPQHTPSEAPHEAPRNIVVGVAGGIAAYKAAHLVRNFKEHGDDVRVVPTEAALNFVGAATFEALSGNPVSTTVFDAVDEVQHVNVGQHADAVVIAPATAAVIARIAAGRADDLLTATVLVATCAVIVATKTRSLGACVASSSMPPVERMCVLFPGISPDSAIHSALVVQPRSGWMYSSASVFARTVSTKSLGEISACTWHSPAQTWMLLRPVTRRTCAPR